jgi:hypothetical protein
MSNIKRYVLRDATGYYFQSVSDDGLRAYFTGDVECARQFSKDNMASFRAEYDYIKGRVVSLKTARKETP